MNIGCRDTIGEALGVRENLKNSKFKNLLVVTSELHLPRALYLFRRVLGSEIWIEGTSVPSAGILIEEEEKEYLILVENYFARLPEHIAEREFEEWYNNHKDYYEMHLKIHNKYHSGGRESQAYLAVKE